MIVTDSLRAYFNRDGEHRMDWVRLRKSANIGRTKIAAQVAWLARVYQLLLPTQARRDRQ